MGRSETVQCPGPGSSVFAVGEREKAQCIPLGASQSIPSVGIAFSASVQHWELPGISPARLEPPEGCLH